MGFLRQSTEEINISGLVAGDFLVFLACAQLADAQKVIMLLRIWIFGGN